MITNPARKRLQKTDGDLIADALRAKGFRVTSSVDRIEAWDFVNGRLIGSFHWQKAGRLGGGQPAGWRFDVALTDVFSVKDLKTAIREMTRVQSLIGKARAAWKAFVSSRSDKRWMEYRGFVAALFLRQDLGDEE